MKENIAKRYVKALIQTLDKSEIAEASSALGKIASAFCSAKFKGIIVSPEVSKEAKVELLLIAGESQNQKIVNFIKVLAQKERTELIPVIARELSFQNSVMENKFTGSLLSSFDVGMDKIVELEEGLSRKFGAQIKLNNVKSEYPGLKIEIEDLGVEVSFSIDRLKAQMSEHILKAI